MGRLNSAMAVVPPPEKPEKETDELAYVRWLQQMSTDLAESLNGVLLRGARSVPVGLAQGATARATSSGGRLVGWSLRETAGAVAVVRLYDGRSTDAPLVAVANLAASASDTTWLGGVSLTEGLFVEVMSGAVEGAVYLGAAE